MSFPPYPTLFAVGQQHKLGHPNPKLKNPTLNPHANRNEHVMHQFSNRVPENWSTKGFHVHDSVLFSAFALCLVHVVLGWVRVTSAAVAARCWLRGDTAQTLGGEDMGSEPMYLISDGGKHSTRTS